MTPHGRGLSRTAELAASGPSSRPPLSLVLPVHDEEENLGPLAAEIREALEGYAGSWEAIFVDDGSHDGSAAVLRRLCAEEPRFRALLFPVQRGQSAALVAGFGAARGEVVVTLDADGQNDPAEIPRLVAALAGHDMVSGVRAVRRDNWVRRVSSAVANRARNAVLQDGMRDVGCSLKAFRAPALADLPAFDGLHRFLPALLRRRGARLGQLPVSHRPRRWGRSKYGIGNRLGRGLLDLAGVRWLQHRWLEMPAVVDEAGEPPDVRSAGGHEAAPGAGRSGPQQGEGRRTRDLLGLALAAALCFLPGLGARDLWNPDEPRYAQVAREMLVGGEVLVPHLNGEVYSEKPPVFFWLIAAAGALTGELDEVDARLPSAVAAILATLLVYWLAGEFFPRRVALLSAVVYLTCAKVLWQGRVGQIDMALGFLVLLGMTLWVMGWRRSRVGFSYAFFAVAGVATITKGPVGLLPPLLSVVAFLLWQRDAGGLRRLRPGRGLLLWAAVGLAWLLPAAAVAGHDYLDVLLFKQNLERYADPWGHIKPWYYYLEVLPADFFPWSLLLPGALLAARGTRPGREREGFRLAVCWGVVTLVFFSLSPGKRTVYLLQMYPALALLVGYGIDRGLRRRILPPAWFSGPLAAAGVLLLAVAAGAPWLAEVRAESAVLGAGSVAAAAFGLALAGAGMSLAAREMGQRRAFRGALAGGAGMAALALVTTLWVLPPLDAVKSARPLAEVVTAKAAPGEPLGVFPRPEPAFLFYTGRTYQVLDDADALRAYLALPGRRWVLALEPALRPLGSSLPAERVARDADPVEGYVLLRSRGG